MAKERIEGGEATRGLAYPAMTSEHVFLGNDCGKSKNRIHTVPAWWK